MKLRVLARLIRIQRVLVRHGLDEFIAETHLYRPLRFVFLASPQCSSYITGEVLPIIGGYGGG